MKSVCCITCRDVSDFLPSVFKNIEKLNNFFDSFKAIFFYDKSKDKTLSILLEEQKIKDYIIIIDNSPNELKKLRTHRLAEARNKLVETVYNKFGDYNFFIVMDSDDIGSYELDLKILEYYLSENQISEWDSLSFNRSSLPGGNYDIWALQYEPFIQHCHSYGGNLEVCHLMRKDITQKLNNIGDKLMPCYSAFNGFAIYKLNKFINCAYDGETQKYFSDERIKNFLDLLKNKYKINVKRHDYVDGSHGGGKQNCEHIGFHLDGIRKNGAKIKISGNNIFKNNIL